MVITWLRMCCLGFSFESYFPPLFSTLYFLEGSHYMQLTRNGILIYASTSGVEYLHKLLGILLHCSSVCCPPFLHLFNHLLYQWTQGYLCDTLSYNSILLNCVIRVPALVIGSSFRWLLCALDIP